MPIAFPEEDGCAAAAATTTYVIGRLKDGVSFDAGARQMNRVVAKPLDEQYPKWSTADGACA